MTKETLPTGPDGFKGMIEGIASLTQEQRQTLLDALNDPEIEEKARLNELKAIGENLNLRKVEGGKFICIEGKGYRDLGVGEVYYPASKTDDWGFNLRREWMGHFASNNSVLTYIDAEGNIYVGSRTKENEQALIHAGYEDESNNFCVYFSDGEQFVDEKWQKKREKIMGIKRD